MSSNLYRHGGYATLNPSWHVEHSAWKARHVLRMLRRNGLSPKTIAEIGCGAGEVLKQLHDALGEDVRLVGYDVSPQAHELSRPRASERLRFELGDFAAAEGSFDLVLLIDVVEHVDDYLGLLRRARAAGGHTLIHLPLEISVQTVLRPAFFRAVHRSAGHLHFFSRETALLALEEAGYEVIDSTFTSAAIDFRPTSLVMTLAWLPRKLLSALSPVLASRLLGGLSLLVLAR